MILEEILRSPVKKLPVLGQLGVVMVKCQGYRLVMGISSPSVNEFIVQKNSVQLNLV
jgi:hypothetical protein